MLTPLHSAFPEVNRVKMKLLVKRSLLQTFLLIIIITYLLKLICLESTG